MRPKPAEASAVGQGRGVADPRALAVFFVFFAQAAAFASWLPRLPELKAAFGLSEGELGALLMALPAGAIAAAPLAGLATAHASPRALNVAAMAWLLAAIALIGAAPGPVPLAAVLLLVGLGGGAMGVVMNAAGLAVEEALGRPILSRCHALYSVGLATGALLAGVFLAAGASILAHLATVAAVILMAVLAVARWLPGDAPEVEGDVPRFAWPSGALLVPAAVACGCLLAEGAAVDWSAVYLDTVLSAPAAAVGLGVAAFSGAMALVRFGGDRLTERLGERRLVTGGAAAGRGGLRARGARARPPRGPGRVPPGGPRPRTDRADRAPHGGAAVAAQPRPRRRRGLEPGLRGLPARPSTGRLRRRGERAAGVLRRRGGPPGRGGAPVA